MNLGYYPGCTLKDKAKSLDETTHLAMKLLGSELREIPDWTCCGATTPLSDTAIANLVPQTRLLIKTRNSGYDGLVTTCPFCFSTLKRVNSIFAEDALKRKRINSYLADDHRKRKYDEPVPDFVPYSGETKVVHLLEYLRDGIGFSKIKAVAKNSLRGMKVAPFYGCQLLRPSKEMALDDPENPTLFEEFLGSMGIEVIDFPARIDCCGSYLSVPEPKSAIRACHAILQSASDRGADAVAVTCPLCFYNLDELQPEIKRSYPDFKSIPILYFTELLAFALGASPDELDSQVHLVNPVPLMCSVSSNRREVHA